MTPRYWCLPPVRDKRSAEPRGGYPMYLVTQGRRVGVWHNWPWAADIQQGRSMATTCWKAVSTNGRSIALGVHPHAAAPPQRKQRGSTTVAATATRVSPSVISGPPCSRGRQVELGLQAQLQEFCITNLDALSLGSAAETTSASTPSNVSSVTVTMWVAVPPVAQYFALWGGRIVYTDCGDAKAAFLKAQAAGTKPRILSTTDYDEAQAFSESWSGNLFEWEIKGVSDTQDSNGGEMPT
ncbi:hypothetical protein B0H14DRAFT_2569032 [Mycena olivaceomarginata]|nr:hypothetical protein B0H14DRAFT_2569032 [Mycena olivaceomarginata]